MTAKGIHVLRMLFSFAWIVLESEAVFYKPFDYIKNVDYPRPNGSAVVRDYCAYLIKAKNITDKKANVFINEPENVIKSLCPDRYTGPVETPVLKLTACRYFGNYLVILGTYGLSIYCENGRITGYYLKLRIGGKL
uniref:Ribonuclease n=1 Tax=Erythrolamprus poecilogyrus TaxID=338838 RepID=I0BWS8_ERYPO|nr:ribonuclease [Erythrolamprus poecilogyrus]